MPIILVFLGVFVSGLYVIDGDTVYHGSAKYRMATYDTPEYYPRARCAADAEEREHAQHADA